MDRRDPFRIVVGDLARRTSYSVTVTRSYEQYGQRQRTGNLDKDDLLPATKELDDAYTWMQRSSSVSRGNIAVSRG
jgi:hypothetical protein